MKEKKQGKHLTLPDVVILFLLGILCFYGIFRAAFNGIGEKPENILYRTTKLSQPLMSVPVSEINDTGLLILVDKDHPVSDVNIADLEDTEKPGVYLRPSVNTAWSGFVGAAEQQKFHFNLISGFRNHQKQQELFDKQVEGILSQKNWKTEKAETEAEKSVARPGNSEHHLGLALDFDVSGVASMDANALEKDPSFDWIKENAATYGFVMSYPKGKQKVTGIKFEPWHLRYYGLPHAAIMQKNNYVLKQYLAALKLGNWYKVRNGDLNYIVGRVEEVNGSISVPSYKNMQISSDGFGTYVVTAWEK